MGNFHLPVYTFFSQISNTLGIVIYSLVISFLYPDLIRNIGEKNRNSYKNIKKRMIIEITVILLGSTLFALFFLDYLLVIIGKNEFVDYKIIFYIMLAANYVLNISYVYNFILVGFKSDLKNIISSMITLIYIIISTFILTKYMGIYGSLIAKLSGYILLLFLKIYYSQHEERKISNNQE